MKIDFRINIHPLAILILLMAGWLTTGCRNTKDAEQPERAAFEFTTLRIAIGETVADRVLNAVELEVMSCPAIVDVRIDGTVVMITGMRAGNGRLAVKADGHAVYCDVEVYDGGGDSDAPDLVDLTQFLSDRTMRAGIGGDVWRFDEPGTLMMLSENRKRVEMRKLATGQELIVKLSRPIDGLQIGDVLDASWCSVKTDGEELGVERCEVVGSSGECLWLRLFTIRRGVCLIAIDRTL